MKNKRIIVNWILFLGWMSFIFFMSNQTGDVSTKQSDLVVKIFIGLGLDQKESMLELTTVIVRKTAHFTEYFILGILTMNLFQCCYRGKKQRSIALLFVLMYASLDEVHQYFIPGRSMAFKDVIIDTLGGGVAILTHSAIIRFRDVLKSIFIEKRVELY